VGQGSEKAEPSQSPGRALTPTARPTHSRSAVGRGYPMSSLAESPRVQRAIIDQEAEKRMG